MRTESCTGCCRGRGREEGRGGAEFCTGCCQVSNLRPSAFQYQPSPLIAAEPCRLTTSVTHHSLWWWAGHQWHSPPPYDAERVTSGTHHHRTMVSESPVALTTTVRWWASHQWHSPPPYDGERVTSGTHHHRTMVSGSPVALTTTVRWWVVGSEEGRDRTRQADWLAGKGVAVPWPLTRAVSMTAKRHPSCPLTAGRRHRRASRAVPTLAGGPATFYN